jgi:hypothetical protein
MTWFLRVLISKKWIIAGLAIAIGSAWLTGYMQGLGSADVKKLKAERDGWMRAYQAVEMRQDRQDNIKQEMKKAVGNVEGVLDDDFYLALDCLHNIRKGDECVSAFTALAAED